jgi:class 3 adenylate cyclase/tetratricopeptide (TPR) repeat protein
MFCDLVGSTALSEQLDPEEYREVVRVYQETCTEVIRRYDGQIAQHLGDGLLVYFGYPIAHEDDAQRAVRAGLEIVSSLQRFSSPSPFQGEGRGEGSVSVSSSDAPHPSPLPSGAREIHVRIGIHTGLVVIGEIGSSEKREILALGETPNLAARLQALAEPDTVVISAATQRLVQGLFTYQDLGPQELKGITTPVTVYQVLGESGVQSRFEMAVQAGLTPLVGRDEELALLRRRWCQAQNGEGQVVLLSGESGIGKSRLVLELKQTIMQDGAIRIEFRCSPYHQNSAFYPLIEHVQRMLHFAPGDTPQEKLQKLEQTLTRYRFPQADTVPLLAALLSLPQPTDLPPLTLSPQQQKQKTLDVLVRWLFEEAERAAVCTVWEDLHWADPSTLEFLTVCLDQVPTARMLKVLTFRPEFTPTWVSRSHFSHLMLSRLRRIQSSAIVEKISGEKALPVEVVQQIVAKTDGVPLFVEELTKSVIESEVAVGARRAVPLQIPIPATLQDALMARLDRLGAAKELAQIGAVLGREFSYELLHAVSPVNEDTFQHGLRQLVEAELVYQSGVPPQARYLFKHALVQDTAYQSLLKNRRQQLHQQVARVLTEQFPEPVETQPELAAHHYTEAGLIEQAIPYWQQAGQRAVERSANVEAINHLTKGLELLKHLPETAECTPQELTLQTALGSALVVTKGLGAPEVRDAYNRAWQLCQQIGEPPQLFPALFGLASYYRQQEEMQRVTEIGKQLLTLAEKQQGSVPFMLAYRALLTASYWGSDFVRAREYAEQGVQLYDPQRHGSLGFVYGVDLGVAFLIEGAWALWYLGYPDQALQKSQAAVTLARDISHPYSLAWALAAAAWTHLYRREGRAARTLAEEAVRFSSTQDFPHWVAMGTMVRGWALAELGQWQEGISLMQQGITGYWATGARLGRACWVAQVAKTFGQVGQVEEGLHVITEAMVFLSGGEVRHYEAEVYRLKGELLLAQEIKKQKAKGKRQKKLSVVSSQLSVPDPQSEAEACFFKAIEIARKQQAKSLELCATVSLARLWQQQGKHHKARNMLSEIYNWFTEGFDTKDLQEAKALLAELT